MIRVIGQSIVLRRRPAGGWTLRIFGAVLNRIVLAFVGFWNIPVLGAEETDESRYLRTRHFK
jgi:hypothetical protein